MKIAFLGDFMPSGDQEGVKVELSSHLATRLASFDFRVATLETAVGSYDEIDALKMSKTEVAVWSHADDLQKLQELNINVVSMANNHACDCGIDAMLQLKTKLNGMGIMTVGAGDNAEEAMRPAVLEMDGESIAIIGACKDDTQALGTLPFATSTSGGLYRLDEQVVSSQIRELKKRYTYVLVAVHWGVEHNWLPEISDVDTAKKLVAAGADAIIGGHPHHIQPFKTKDLCPIFYSLGNFYFPDFYLDSVSNVYYPSEKEKKRLPKYDMMCPDKRDFAMYYFWRYFGRLGMVAALNVRGGKKQGRYFTTVYRKGRVYISSGNWFHHLTMGLLSAFIGNKQFTRIVNRGLMRAGTVWRYKVLAIFLERYRIRKQLNG